MAMSRGHRLFVIRKVEKVLIARIWDQMLSSNAGDVMAWGLAYCWHQPAMIQMINGLVNEQAEIKGNQCKQQKEALTTILQLAPKLSCAPAKQQSKIESEDSR